MCVQKPGSSVFYSSFQGTVSAASVLAGSLKCLGKDREDRDAEQAACIRAEAATLVVRDEEPHEGISFQCESGEIAASPLGNMAFVVGSAAWPWQCVGLWASPAVLAVPAPSHHQLCK